MPYDTARYANLISRAAFDMSAYRGTFQDLSPNRLAMTAVGAPSWTMINGLPALRQNAAVQGTTSAAVPRIVDITGSFSLETVFCGRVVTAGNSDVLVQLGAAAVGGFLWYWPAAGGNKMLSCQVYGAAGYAHEWYSPLLSASPNVRIHFIHNSNNAGATCKGWLNGVPVTMTKAGVGVPSNIGADRAVETGTAALAPSSATADFGLIRAYPFAFTNEDAAAAYGAVHAMFPEV